MPKKKFPCGFCDSNVTNDGIQCDACTKWYHFGCTKLKEKIYKAIEGSEKELSWFCALCKPDVKNMLSNFERFKKVDHEIEKNKKAIDDKIKECLRNFKPVVPAVQAENVQEIVTNLITERNTNDGELRSEEAEIERRKPNLIFFGVPESSSTDSSARMLEDFHLVKSLYEDKVDIEPQNVKSIFRIGKADDRGRNRPLLLKFESVDLKNNLLRNSKDIQLRKDNEIVRIGVSPDRTQKQREIHKSLVVQLRERMTNGERNMVIRNGKIIANFQKETVKPRNLTWAQVVQKL